MGGPTVSNLVPKLANVNYLALIDTNSGYHNIRFDQKITILYHFRC